MNLVYRFIGRSRISNGKVLFEFRPKKLFSAQFLTCCFFRAESFGWISDGIPSHLMFCYFTTRPRYEFDLVSYEIICDDQGFRLKFSQKKALCQKLREKLPIFIGIKLGNKWKIIFHPSNGAWFHAGNFGKRSYWSPSCLWQNHQSRNGVRFIILMWYLLYGSIKRYRIIRNWRLWFLMI